MTDTAKQAETQNGQAVAERAADALANKLPNIADWLPEPLLPAWETISTYPLLGALLVATTFYFFALLFRSTLLRLLQSAAGLTRSAADDAVLEELRKPIFTTIFFFGLTLAVNVAQMPLVRQFLVNLLLSVIVASWMRASFRISSTVLDSLANSHRFSLIESRTVPLFDLTSKLLVILFGSYVLLMIWGINPVGWLASAGIVGIAVGFAAKDTLANLFSGFFIVADAPYKIGDYVTLDTGERGRVSAIGLRSTRLMTRDDVEITIPNGVIAAAKIVNESGGPSAKMRIAVMVGVAYGSDVDRVCQVLGDIGNAHNETCQTPKPRVRMRAFGASSLDFELLCWVEHPEDKGRISHELLMAIYKALAANHIEIPFSKHDIYIKEMPGSPANTGNS